MFDVTTREIFLYDDIGPAWAGMFGAETLLEGLKAFGPGDVHLRINSYGGSVDEALAMIEILDRHDGDVYVSVDSIAASAATVFPAVFPATAAAHARIMIHNPWTVVMGDANTIRKEADVLDTYRDSIVEVYSNAMNASKDEIMAMMDEETWMNADQALQNGFISEIKGKGADANPAPANRFKNVPQDLKEPKKQSAKVTRAEKLASKLKMIQIRSKVGR